ncbi:MAG: glycoside hydrolase family 3 protein [Solirubrobacterales bacterium]|nr:glycoside hydrolase family 3 protein [Solirubrobacterales bacterium]
MALAGLAFIAGCSLALPEPEEDSVSPTAMLPDACSGELADAAGQKLMVRMEDTATPELLGAAREGEIGGVILFPTSPEPTEALAAQVAKLQRAAAAGARPPLLVATDQEGGPVERFEGPPDIAPAELDAAGGAAEARRQGEATGRLLAGLGVNVDLAPVLDVGVPGASVDSRTFGDQPAAVAELGGAFADGLEASGVDPVVKHFPGIGRTFANTDLEPTAIGAGAGVLETDIEPFRAAIDAGVPAVMVANAAYPALGSAEPAVTAPEIVTDLLRERLGFHGVAFSDDLLAGAISSSLGPEEAAIESSAAGVDVLLFAAAPVSGIADQLAAAAKSGKLDERQLRESCARVVALKLG